MLQTKRDVHTEFTGKIDSSFNSSKAAPPGRSDNVVIAFGRRVVPAGNALVKEKEQEVKDRAAAKELERMREKEREEHAAVLQRTERAPGQSPLYADADSCCCPLIS